MLHFTLILPLDIDYRESLSCCPLGFNIYLNKIIKKLYKIKLMHTRVYYYSVFYAKA